MDDVFPETGLPRAQCLVFTMVSDLTWEIGALIETFSC